MNKNPLKFKVNTKALIKNIQPPEEIQDKPLGRTICGEKIVFIAVKKTKLQPLKIFVPIAAPHFHLAM